MCKHHSKEHGIVGDFYKANLMLADATTVLKKPMKVALFEAVEQLTRVNTNVFENFPVAQQLEAWHCIMLQFPLCWVSQGCGSRLSRVAKLS